MTAAHELELGLMPGEVEGHDDVAHPELPDAAREGVGQLLVAVRLGAEHRKPGAILDRERLGVEKCDRAQPELGTLLKPSRDEVPDATCPDDERRRTGHALAAAADLVEVKGAAPRDETGGGEEPRPNRLLGGVGLVDDQPPRRKHAHRCDGRRADHRADVIQKVKREARLVVPEVGEQRDHERARRRSSSPHRDVAGPPKGATVIAAIEANASISRSRPSGATATDRRRGWRGDRASLQVDIGDAVRLPLRELGPAVQQRRVGGTSPHRGERDDFRHPPEPIAARAEACDQLPSAWWDSVPLNPRPGGSAKACAEGGPYRSARRWQVRKRGNRTT